ncbi:MAG: stage 0 sporulation family protein [Thermomicrobiales bacterium]
MATQFPGNGVESVSGSGFPPFPRNIEEMRAAARERFKDRVLHGGLGAGCECHDSPRDLPDAAGNEPHPCVVGVRFIDSGQVYYYDSGSTPLELNDWIVVETSRGQEAAKVVIAPSNIALSQISGELKPIVRQMDASDVETMERMRRESATAIRTFNARIRHHGLKMKPISAEYSFDGSSVVLNFTASDRVDFRELARDMASQLKCRVELRQVGPRDEARLLGGVGKCGRTLCCATWLPMFPEVNMGMAKSQDLSLNPGKVSGVCGRLLCCLSYENEQYRQMKAVMPKLGQMVQTERGAGTVISLQILKDLVTVRLETEGADVQFTAAELGFEAPGAKRPRIVQVEDEVVAPPTEIAQEVETEPVAAAETPVEGEAERAGGGRKRRRRRRGRGGQKPAE